jgi:hypothetical protein
MSSESENCRRPAAGAGYYWRKNERKMRVFSLCLGGRAAVIKPPVPQTTHGKYKQEVAMAAAPAAAVAIPNLPLDLSPFLPYSWWYTCIVELAVHVGRRTSEAGHPLPAWFTSTPCLPANHPTPPTLPFYYCCCLATMPACFLFLYLQATVCLQLLFKHTGISRSLHLSHKSINPGHIWIFKYQNTTGIERTIALYW